MTVNVIQLSANDRDCDSWIRKKYMFKRNGRDRVPEKDKSSGPGGIIEPIIQLITIPCEIF